MNLARDPRGRLARRIRYRVRNTRLIAMILFLASLPPLEARFLFVLFIVHAS